MISANPVNPIVAFIYGFTFLVPFAGMIVSPSSGSIVLELSRVFAVLVYAPDHMGCAKNSLAANLPPALAGTGHYSNDNKRAPHPSINIRGKNG